MKKTNQPNQNSEPASGDGNLHPLFPGFVGSHNSFKVLFRLARIYAQDPKGSSILITGERGTGKELMALYVHRQSVCLKRKDVFVSVNCGAINKNLCQSELFGHVKGSFSGADRNKPGYFAEAGGGSLYLDEIGNLLPEIQPLLLRVSEYRTYRRVGDDNDHTSDARLIFATNRDLHALASRDEFMPDLLDRLCQRHIHLLPLRDYKDDLDPLIVFLVRKHCKEQELNGSISVHPSVFKCLHSYDFPGNIRELDGIISRAILIMADDNKKVIGPDHILMHPAAAYPAKVAQSEPCDIPSFFDREMLKEYFMHHAHLWKDRPSHEVPCLFNVDKIREESIDVAYEVTAQNKAVSASMLGLTVSKLRRLKPCKKNKKGK